jgi:hypothetical protein
MLNYELVYRILGHKVVLKLYVLMQEISLHKTSATIFLDNSG